MSNQQGPWRGPYPPRAWASGNTPSRQPFGGPGPGKSGRGTGIAVGAALTGLLLVWAIGQGPAQVLSVAGLVALFTGGHALVRGGSWVGPLRRKTAAIMAGGGLMLTVVGTAAGQTGSHPTAAAPAPKASAVATAPSSPTPSRAVTPTPTLSEPTTTPVPKTIEPAAAPPSQPAQATTLAPPPPGPPPPPAPSPSPPSRATLTDRYSESTTRGSEVKIFANCQEWVQVYPNGVGRPGATDTSKGTPKKHPNTSFERNAEVYQANLPRDGDGDGVACEDGAK